MPQRYSARKLAMAAVGAAISLLAVTLAFYVQALSTSFYVLAAFGLLLPLTQGYWKEAIFAYIAVSAIGAIYTGLYILPFVLVTGGYTVAAVAFRIKNVKPFIIYPVAVAYSCLVFWLLYQITGVLFVDWEGFQIGSLAPGALYAIGNVIFSLVFVVYDICIIWAYKWLAPIVKKINRS